MSEFEFLTPPLIKEILEQQRIMLEIHQALMEVLSKPVVICREEKEAENVKSSHQ